MKGFSIVALRSLSVCTGVGGLDLGIELAFPGSFRPLCYVEREAYAAAILAKAMEAGVMDPAPIWDDVKTICSQPVRAVVGAGLGGERLGVICGGYPCQPFSCAGRRDGANDPRHLWPHIALAVAAYNPLVCVFENVGGHLSLGFRAVAEDLESMGYTVAAGLFTAAEVGASHRRERLFIVAMADAQGVGWREGRAESGGIKGRLDATERGGPMADSGNDGRGREGSRRQPGKRTAIAGPSLPAIGDGGESELGDPCRDGRPTRIDGADRITDREGGARLKLRRCDLPAFPPGPNALDDWRRILGHDPTIEPAIQRVANGPAARLDRHRHRAIGNAVLPLQAAYAIRTLFDALLS